MDYIYVAFHFLTAVTIKNNMLWDVTPWRLLEILLPPDYGFIPQNVVPLDLIYIYYFSERGGA
jgi:hypothetical protein